MTLFSRLGVVSVMAAPSRLTWLRLPPPSQPDSGPPALPICAKDSVRHRPSGDEIEITPEMIKVGGAIMADRLEKPLDWLTKELDREIYVAMVRTSTSR